MKRQGIAILGLVLGVLCIAYSLRLGAIPLTWAQTFDGVWGKADEQTNIIIHELRLPRALMAALSGGVLAASGVIAQAILRNPMAAPSLIGISAGAGFAAALAIVLPIPFLMLLPSIWMLPFAAFLGSALSAGLVFSLARGSGRTDTGMILLAGLAINSLAGAGTGLLTFVADDPQLRNISFWNLGSVAGAEWSQIGVLLLFSLPLIVSVLNSGATLNAWMLGEEEAQLLGVSVERQKRLQMIAIALAVGASVSFTGVIGFIGLIVPHLLRFLIGPDHRSLLLQSFIWGAVLLLVSDLIARVIVVPLELPIGIVTALIGAPYFIFLLRQQYQRSRVYDPA
ncbi:MAG: iron ABC transporter permease [Bdellovibrionota bacterium]